MSDKKHTPVPWIIGINGYHDIGVMNSASGGSEDKVNADFIIKAVNNHDKLVDMLKQALIALNQVENTDICGKYNTSYEVCSAIEETLREVS